MAAKIAAGPRPGQPQGRAGNSSNCHNCGQPGHYKANCLQLQQPTWAAGVCIEAKASNEEVQEASPEEDSDMIDWDQPQGEGDEPEYKEHLTDIPREWDEEGADIQEWDEDYDTETQTEYCSGMILAFGEYHN
jgi:hypothetical protein